MTATHAWVLSRNGRPVSLHATRAEAEDAITEGDGWTIEERSLADAERLELNL